MNKRLLFFLVASATPAALSAASIASTVYIDFDVVGSSWGSQNEYSGTPLGEPFIVSEFTFSFLDNHGNSGSYGFRDSGENNSPAIFFSGSGEGEKFTITSANDSTFRFESFYLNNSWNDGYTTAPWTATGYLNGESIGSVDFSGSGARLVSFGSEFYNVDSIVILPGSSSEYDYVGFNGASVDSFTFAPAIVAVPEPATMAGITGLLALGYCVFLRRRK